MAIPLIPPLTDFQRDVLMWARKTMEDDPLLQSLGHYFEIANEDVVVRGTELDDLVTRGILERHRYPVFGGQTISRHGFEVMPYGWELAGVLLGREKGGMI